jgi:hypothetical protein
MKSAATMPALMSHAGPKHQQLFPRILDCCRLGIHKNAKFISQTPAMADFAYTNVGLEETHTTLGVHKLAGTGVPNRVAISTETRSFAADLLQVQRCGNHEYN